eukprot:CAMPEP_0168763186 /NCGR_PEP_ID=MMETSP0724-20121128/24229_1 /TAXON_ID=265536 /ORGANISM="Amphiprora sp., Strain CCMP467" /LENGTH=730 /DNA_ID=CAMNT_0008812373 /DNA_START=1 /DNA_END=2193 /DNA_ORIENTATION=+
MTMKPLMMNRVASLSSVGQTHCTNMQERGSFLRRVSYSRRHRPLSTFQKSPLVMMPEGPEVRVLVKQLKPAIGARLADWKFLSGRYADHRNADGYQVEGNKPRGWHVFKNTMTQHDNDDSKNKQTNKNSTNDALPAVDVVEDIACKGKFVYILLDKGNALGNNADEDWQRSIWVTLGMAGRFVSQKVHDQKMTPTQQAQARWYMELIPLKSKQEDGDDRKRIRIYYFDTRNFGTLRFSISASELVDKLQSLGPDILSRDGKNKSVLTRADFFNLIEKQQPTLNVCKFLMNQQKISGVGNYILAEALYRACIDPYAALQELSSKQREDLYFEVMAVANESFQSQLHQQEQKPTAEGISTDIFELQCYGRDRCAQRGDRVIRDVNGPHGRTIWFTGRQLCRPLQEREHYRLFNKKPGQQYQQQEQPSIQQQYTTKSSRASTRRGQPAFDREYASNPFQDASINSPQEELSLDDAKASLIRGITDPTWKLALHDAMDNSTSFDNLVQFLQQEKQAGYTIFPPTNKEIFAALNACPLPKVRVVILGQDPYHGKGQAHGLAFSVKKGVSLPPSLRNIFTELQEEGYLLEDEDGVPSVKRRQTHGNLQHWANQGVLLLNTVLTVREGEANSHANQGWEEFTDAVIHALLGNSSDDGNPHKSSPRRLVFLLWGNPAAKKATACSIDSNQHMIIRSSHPSPLSARRTKTPFMSSQCFRKANSALVEMGYDPIDWSLSD